MGELIIMDGSGFRAPVEKCSLEVAECDTSDLVVLEMSCNDSMYGTFECKIDNLVLLSLLMGRKITNNWLKMHGGVMRRKRGLRR